MVAGSDISFEEGFCASISRFSRSFLSLAAWHRQEELPGSPAVAHNRPLAVESDAPPGSSLPPLCVYQPKSERACRSCSLCCHPVCTTFARVNTAVIILSLPSTNQPNTTISLHSTQTSTPHPPRLSNPRSRTLGSETRHPRTDKPARVARCVAPSCAALFCICSNGHLTPAYIHLLATNNCSTIARSLPYMQLLLPLTKVAR